MALGAMEVVILVALGLLCLAVPIAIVVTLVLMGPKKERE